MAAISPISNRAAHARQQQHGVNREDITRLNEREGIAVKKIEQ
jgi:hypothetical protein